MSTNDVEVATLDFVRSHLRDLQKMVGNRHETLFYLLEIAQVEAIRLRNRKRAVMDRAAPNKALVGRQDHLDT